MSEPVTNAEVEDVLSSIRRLVSEDRHPLKAQKAAVMNDRLVLTPALRVAEAAEDEVEPDAVKERSEDESAAQSSDQDQEAIFNDPAHDYDADHYNFADETDEDGEGDEDEVRGLSRPKTEDDNHHVPEDESATPKASTDDTKTSASTALSAKIEALESAIGNIPDAWEPDEPGSDEYSGTQSPAMAWEDDIDRDPMGALVDDGDDDEDNVIARASTASPKQAAPERTPDPEPEPQSDTASEQSLESDTPDDDIIARASTASPKQAAPEPTPDLKAEPQSETASEQSSQIDTPDDDEDNIIARASTASPKQAAPEPTPDPKSELQSDTASEQSLQSDTPDDDGFAFASDDQLIDEDALRDLVSDIVRSELQGALGERITRNVRKLVRREIHRALAAQELE